jgi:hypothetical protein
LGYQTIIRRLRRRAPLPVTTSQPTGHTVTRTVAAVLQGLSDIGDGDLHRVIRDVATEAMGSITAGSEPRRPRAVQSDSGRQEIEPLPKDGLVRGVIAWDYGAKRATKNESPLNTGLCTLTHTSH